MLKRIILTCSTSNAAIDMFVALQVCCKIYDIMKCPFLKFSKGLKLWTNCKSIVITNRMFMEVSK